MAFKSELVALTGSDQDIYEFPATFDGGALLFLVNSQNAVRDVTVKFYKHATGVTTSLGAFPVPAHTPYQFPVKFGLESGDKIIASCSASGVVAYATVIVGGATPAARGFTPRGQWDADATYAVNDVALVGRDAHVAVNGNTNDEPPSANWLPFVIGGEDGPPGSGNVSTSGSVANNRLAAFDGTGGDIKDSGKTIADFAAVADGITSGERAKLGHITVTQAVDLDDIEAKVTALDQAVILKGTWNANGGTFPGAGVAQAGWAYIVGTGGTVNGQTFANGDRIIAITDNASTGTFAGNWFKEDYTDAVLSINGATGAVTVEGIITAAAAKTSPVDADVFAGVDSASSNSLAKFSWATIKAALLAAFKSTAANFWAGVNDATFLTPKNIADAAARVALTSGANISTNAALGRNFYVVLGHNALFDAPTNMIDGVAYTWIIKQPSSGGPFTGAFNSIFEFPSAPTLSAAASKYDMVSGVYNSTDNKLVARFSKGS